MIFGQILYINVDRCIMRSLIYTTHQRLNKSGGMGWAGNLPTMAEMRNAY
jgi:hypothetical protein